MTEVERAWAAGFWDGEGCATHTSHDYAQAQLNQVDRSVLETFRNVVGGVIRGPYQYPRASRPNSRPQFQWSVVGYQPVLRLARILWPYLGTVKRDQFKRILQAHLAWRT
jgi:hypothetical protein